MHQPALPTVAYFFTEHGLDPSFRIYASGPGILARDYLKAAMGEERIAQEIILGIGGVNALKAMGIQPDVYHFNEGHAVLAGFELIRQNMAEGMSSDKALEAARNKILFTTHTPVIEGNESHPINQMMYMGANNTLNYEQTICHRWSTI